MKKALLIITIFFALGFLNAQQHYQFRTDTPQGFSVEKSTPSGLSLHYSIAEIGIEDIENDEAKGQEIELKGCFGSFAEGLPNLPFENRYIAVPQGARVSVTVKEKGSQTLTGIDLLPAAPLQSNAAKGTPKLHKDMSVFGKDANYPAENVAIAQTTQIRGLDVILLHVTPFRYNPMRKTLEVIYDMDIEVRFEGGNGQFGEARYRNPDWDGILRDLVINGDMLPEAHYYERLNKAVKNREEGCEYLIISPDDESILAYADTLRQFRTRQGILTKVVSTTECGGNESESIKNYIKNAYEHWAIPPAAVMIFGGIDTIYVGSSYYGISSGIPGFGLVFLGYDNGHTSTDYHYSSDNPYADMNDDSIPDLVLSRLPAMTLNEYRTQVNKLIQYETNPPTQPNYYDRPLITSSYEYNKWFLITSQSVNGFFRNKLGRNPYNFYMVYAQSDPIFPDTAWSTGYNTDVVVDYFGPNGQNYIAQCPDTLNDWRNPMDYSYLTEALNQSSFLTMYRDHSSFDLWCSPWMESSEIRNLENTDPTFVLSIGCDAGLYSNAVYYETSNSYFYYGDKPIIKEFCIADAGALGGIGAVTVTFSHFNDMLTWGLLDYFWPDFMPTLGTNTNPSFCRPSYALVAGKLFLNQHAFLPHWWPYKITTTNNVFHDLGETYLNLFTETPQQIAIEVAPFITDPSKFQFKAEEGTLVCMTYNDEILMVIEATGQTQTINLPQLSIGDRLWVTATKQNRVRFEQEVIVILPNQPYVYAEDFVVNSLDDNGQLDAGESTDIDVHLRNYSNFESDKGSITLSCESPYVEITQNTASYPSINPEATHTIKSAFRVKIANDAPDQLVVRFIIKFDENENTHEDFFNRILNAPLLTIHPDFLLRTTDDEPSNHIIPAGTTKLTCLVTNKGHSCSSPLQASLTIKAPFVHIEEPAVLVEAIAPGQEQEINFLISSDDEENGAWLKSSLDIQHLSSHLLIDTTLQYSGIFERFETDTLNDNFRWTNSGNNPWTYDDEDACEGQRCFMVSGNAADAGTNTLKAMFKANTYLNHQASISFKYKTSENDIMFYHSDENHHALNSTEWTYSTWPIEINKKSFTWYRYRPDTFDDHTFTFKIDDICFPPRHRIIAHAGKAIHYCSDTGVEISNAYAYDCDSVYWTSEGDGYFEVDYEINPTYHPGNDDLHQGEVLLTLHAVSRTDTVNSSVSIGLFNESGTGSILGDSLVNIFNNPISHYYVEPHEGIVYQWKLEPVEAGWVYANKNEVDILWNNNEAFETAVITVAIENGCDWEAILPIQLVGHNTQEWHSLDLKLYPNPTNGKIHLVAGESLQGKILVEVFNLMGQRIISHLENDLMKGAQITLNLESYASGLYLVKLSTSQGNYLDKVSVK